MPVRVAQNDFNRVRGQEDDRPAEFVDHDIFLVLYEERTYYRRNLGARESDQIKVFQLFGHDCMGASLTNRVNQRLAQVRAFMPCAFEIAGPFRRDLEIIVFAGAKLPLDLSFRGHLGVDLFERI